MSEEEIKKLREVAYYVEKMLNIHHARFEDAFRRLEEFSTKLTTVSVDLADVRSEVRTTARFSGGVSGAVGGVGGAALVEIVKHIMQNKGVPLPLPTPSSPLNTILTPLLDTLANAPLNFIYCPGLNQMIFSFF